MKNEYVKPEMLVVGLDSEGVLAMSSTDISDESLPPSAPSRRQNAWDEYRNN